MKINVMTFNTQHCKNFLSNQIDYDSICNLIQKYKADIIGLNEIYGKRFDRNIKASQAEEIASRLGYYCYFGKATYLNFKAYGNALISKYPIISARVIKVPFGIIRLGNRYYEKRSIIEAIISINNKQIKVYVCHFGLNDDEQNNAVNALIANIKADDSFIIMGDFNTFPENIILKDIKNITKDTSDYYDGPKLSWPSNKPKVKYDYILTSKNIKTIKSTIASDIVSDHLAIVSQIEL